RRRSFQKMLSRGAGSMLWERRCAPGTDECVRPHIFFVPKSPLVWFCVESFVVEGRTVIILRFMFWARQNRYFQWGWLFILWAANAAAPSGGGSCYGTLYDAAGKPLAGAEIRVRAIAGGRDYQAATSQDGTFAFAEMEAGAYEISVKTADRRATATFPVAVTNGNSLQIALQLTSSEEVVQMQSPQSPSEVAGAKASAQASGGEHLSGTEVSS